MLDLLSQTRNDLARAEGPAEVIRQPEAGPSYTSRASVQSHVLGTVGLERPPAIRVCSILPFGDEQAYLLLLPLIR